MLYLCLGLVSICMTERFLLKERMEESTEVLHYSMWPFIWFVAYPVTIIVSYSAYILEHYIRIEEIRNKLNGGKK